MLCSDRHDSVVFSVSFRQLLVLETIEMDKSTEIVLAWELYEQGLSKSSIRPLAKVEIMVSVVSVGTRPAVSTIQ